MPGSVEPPAGECLACDVVAGRIGVPGGVIFEDERWRVDHSASPVVLAGFLIIKPKRHCESVSELSDDELLTLGPILGGTTRALARVLMPERIYVCSFGETHRHVHWYVIPRTADMPPAGPDLIWTMFEEQPWACSDEKAAQVAGQVRAAWNSGQVPNRGDQSPVEGTLQSEM